jgi:glycyl-tRNA synthetase beta chain
MGGYYAAKEGLPQDVSDAIRDHYKPVGQGDDVPTAPVTVAVSLADKLDTITGFFLINEKPTGSKDPFALRRAAIGVLELVLRNGLRMETMHFFARAAGAYARQLEQRPEFQGDYEDGLGKLFTAEFYSAVTDFVLERLKVQQRASGVRHDLIDAVAAVGDDQPVRLLARVHALQAFVTTEDGTNLLAGYKRAANILKKEGFAAGEGEGAQALSYTPEPAEKALIDALDAAAPRAAQAVEDERFADAMAALATLRAPIDRFFEEVTVNDPEADKRSARLALLARFRDAVHRVADFGRIEG